MSKEMGRNLQNQESQLTLKNHNPGCMWGLLHHFQHNRWHHVVKRLPRKRQIGSGKHSTDHGKSRSTWDAGKVQENIDSSVENAAVQTKAIVPTPAHKSSMKSRIKALIKDEMYRRRGRHQRSSSYPTRKPLDATTPVHIQEKTLTIESPVENKSNVNLCSSHDHSVHSTASSDDPSLRKFSEENSSNNIGSCELCDTMLKVNYLKQNEVTKLGKQPVRDHTLLHGNSIYAVEPSQCDSLQESKLFMDALDLLNVRQEVFLKILQDPSSSLAHQLYFRRSPNVRFGLTKSVSFPASERRDFKSEDSTKKQENWCCVREEDELQHHIEEKGENGSPEDFSRELEPSDIATANMLRKKNENKVVFNHFKNIREKIKHVIQDKKREKNRIIKDAVHHKIPCDRSVSKNEGQLGSDFGKSAVMPFKRTSSFNDSFDRYNQLLDISINREAKDHISDTSSFKTEDTQTPARKSPATLTRILSLPDLRSYSSIQIDDSVTNISLITSDTVVINEQEPLDLASESKVQTSESCNQENLLDVGETFEESADAKTSKSALSDDLNLEHVLSYSPQPSKLDEVAENDSKYQEDEIHDQEIEVSVSEDSNFERSLPFPAKGDSSTIQMDLSYPDSCIVSQNMVDIDAQESRIKLFYDELMQVQVDTKDEAKFNYVKDVLELSGFSRDEILGKWHSAEHPLNPSVLEEVEGCLVDQHECEEVFGNSDQVLLFDIINEVLLGIHERSSCYWPTPITSLSRIHQLPKGNRVLEEVWAEIRWLISWRPEFDQAIDEAVSRDLAKRDGWMNLQLDAECVGIELEDMIFDDLLDDLIFDDLLDGSMSSSAAAISLSRTIVHTSNDS